MKNPPSPLKLTAIARAAHFGRDTIAEGLRDPVNWPGVDTALLEKASPTKLSRYNRFREAIEMYLKGATLAACTKIAKVKKSAFYRQFERCLAIHSDGRIWGFRALVRGARVKKGERRNPIKPQAKGNVGLAYVFSDFMKTQIVIREEVTNYLRGLGAKVVRLNELQFRQAHRAFEKACEKDGRIGKDEYPLNKKDKGRRAFRHWMKTVFLPDYGKDWAAREYGPSAETAYDYQDGDGQSTLPFMPGEVWQIDEYKIDVEAGYEYPNAFGDYEIFDLPFTLVVRAIDVGTGARIAVRLVLATQVSADDMSCLLWDAVNGMSVMIEALPGLKPKPGAGYVASMIPALRFHMPRIIYLDNALAHIADHVRVVVEQRFGAELRLGRAGVPQERGAVEASFSKMARGLLRHVQFAVGSGPQDPLRAAARTAGHQRRIASDALDQSIHVYSQNENVLPASASMNISPLERLNRQLETGALVPNYLPADRRHAHFFSKSKPVTVRADVKSKHMRRPYVNYMYQRYSSGLLRRSIDLIGQKLYARPDLDNLQTIWLFNEDGTEFGPVHVLGKWGKFPHDMRIRKMFGKLKAEGALGEHAEDDPLDAIFTALRHKLATDRRAAQKLAYLTTYLKRHGFPVSAVIINEILHWQATVLAAEGISLIPVIHGAPAPGTFAAPVDDDDEVIVMVPTTVATNKADTGSVPALQAPAPLVAASAVVPAPAIVSIVNRAAAAAQTASAPAPAVTAPAQPSFLNLPRRMAR